MSESCGPLERLGGALSFCVLLVISFGTLWTLYFLTAGVASCLFLPFFGKALFFIRKVSGQRESVLVCCNRSNSLHEAFFHRFVLPLFFRSATVFPCTTRLAPLVPASAFTLSTALVSLLTDCRAHRLAFDFSCESLHILIGAGNYILVVRSGIVFCTASKFFWAAGVQTCSGPAAHMCRWRALGKAFG